MSDANCYVDLGNWYPGPCSQTQNTFLNISNNYSNGNLQLSFPEKVPSETEAPQLAYTAYPAYIESYMLHILLYD